MSLKRLDIKIRLVVLSLGLILAAVELFCPAELQYTEPSQADQKLLDELVQPNLNVNPQLMPTNLPRETIEIPLQKQFGKYFFTVQLNGVKTNVMVDYGAGLTLGLTPDTVLRIKAALSDQVQISTSIAGTSTGRSGLLNTVTIGSTTLHDIPFGMGAANIQFIERGMVFFRAEAMMGLPFLVGFKRFTVDLGHNKLVLGKIPDEILKQDKQVRLPVDYRNGALYIKGYLDGAAYDFIVDIGGNNTNTVTLRGNAARTFMKTHSYEEAGQVTGLGDAMVKTYRSTEASIIKAGAYEVRDINVDLVPDSAIETQIIGTPFFGETAVGVDLDKKMLYFLEPPKQTKLGVTVRPIDKSLALEYGFDSIEKLLKKLKIGKAEGLFVAAVIPDSAANKAGILKGDIILAYNNQKLISANQFIDLIRESGVDKKVALGIIRDGEEKSIQLTIGQ
jgi:predicted aspartyl protease